MGIKTGEILPALSTYILTKAGAYDSIPHGNEIASLMIGGQLLKAVSHLSSNEYVEKAIQFAGIAAGAIGLIHLVAPDQIDSFVPMAKTILQPTTTFALIGAGLHGLAKNAVEKTTDALSDPEKGSASNLVSAIYDHATSFAQIVINQAAISRTPESALTNLAQLNQGAAFDRFVNNLFSEFEINFNHKNRHMLGIETAATLASSFFGDLNFVTMFIGASMTRTVSAVLEKIPKYLKLSQLHNEAADLVHIAHLKSYNPNTFINNRSQRNTYNRLAEKIGEIQEIE